MVLEHIDNINDSDRVTVAVLCVGNWVTDYVFKEDHEHITGFLVDKARDTLDTTMTRDTTDSGLGNALDVVVKDFVMTLGASLSKTFASFSANRYGE